uniref:Ribonuclease A-domain domain-containing protein n=1 Tax=Poecilia formosa TaxID=48698 RepID=A0A096LSP1_POEFO
VILLIAVMCSCAVGDEDLHNGHPCQPTNKPQAFKKFEKNHILPENFDTNSKSEWESHIQSLDRCGKPTQTFFEHSNRDLVVKICNGNGWNQQDNLCTSKITLPVYVVKVCRVKTTPRKTEQNVTVACDKVGNRCLPVHYEPKPQTNKQPKVTCSPAAPDYWSDKQFNISIWI